ADLRAKCTFGENLSQWPLEPLPGEQPVGRLAAQSGRHSGPDRGCHAGWTGRGATHPGTDASRDPKPGRPNASLEVSPGEAPVGQPNDRRQPPDHPGDVDNRRWLVGKERI